MGLFNEVKSLITVKADTSQAKAEIRELSGVEKKAAQERLAHIEAGNKKLEGSIATYARAAGAIAAVGIAGKIAFDAIEFSGRRADLQAAAGTVSIERLRKATLGLRTDTQLLELAGKLNHTALKLNAEQMDIAGRAATALAERGGDAQEAFDAVTAALVSGKTKGLAPFGIQVDETKDKAEKFKEIMKQLAKVSGEVSENTLDASDKIGQQRVKFANIFDTVQDGIGKVASEMLPLLDLIMDIGGVVAGLVGGVDGALSGIGRIAKYGIPVYGQVLLVKDSLSGNVMDMARQYAGQRATNEANARLGGTAGQLGGGVNVMFKPQSDTEMPMAYVGSDATKKTGKREGQWGDVAGRAYGGGGNISSATSGALGQGAMADSVPRDEYGNAISDNIIAERVQYEQREKLTADWHARLAALTAGPSIIERMLGPVADIDMYRESFSMLTGAATAGYEAMIDGTMSFGDAVKKSVADALKALGSKMLVQAIGETAAGFAALASGYGMAAAAPHFKSAALYGAGAAAAGLASSALGGSGGSGGGGMGASAPDSRGSSSRGGNTSQGERIIVYEDAFAENNGHERALRAERVVRRVVGSSAVRAR